MKMKKRLAEAIDSSVPGTVEFSGKSIPEIEFMAKVYEQGGGQKSQSSIFNMVLKELKAFRQSLIEDDEDKKTTFFGQFIDNICFLN